MTTRTEQIKQIANQIADLKIKQGKLDRKFRKESREKIDSIPAEYIYEITLPSTHDKPDSFRIHRILTNRNVYNEIIKEYGHPTFVGFESNEFVNSVSYYRTNSIVTHTGGGFLLLHDPFMCDDAEWELLKSGDTETINKYIKA